MAAKISEAEEHCRAAEKYLKTTLLRWNPDFDSAADEYSQAAQCYRIGRNLKLSKECHLKASECYKKNKAFFHAAKALENAIIVSKETSKPEELYALAVESSSLYQQHGSGDSAACVLDKAAKIIEEHAPEQAYRLYQQAAEVSVIQSSQHQGSEYISKATRILVRLQMYDQAVENIHREITFHQESGNMGAIGRLTVALVLVQLARGDNIAADKEYKQYGSSCEVSEMHTIEQLLQAYDEEDRDLAKRALASPFIRNMDIDYARLAQTVPLPKIMDVKPKPAAVAGPSQNELGEGDSYATANIGDNKELDGEEMEVKDVGKNEEEDELC